MFVAPILYLFGYDNKLMLLHPGCMIMSMIIGSSDYILLFMPALIAWFLFLYEIARINVFKMFQRLGGIKS